MKHRAVFLDRDGVLNQAIIKNGKPYPPSSLETLVIPHDVPEALSLLKAAGFLLIGATNQPDVARGITQRETIEQINTALKERLPLDDILICYHDDKDQCTCRKPAPGLLIQAAAQFQIDLSNSFMIGDRWKDIAAGLAAGCQTIWLNYHYQEPFLSQSPQFTTNQLRHAAQWILSQ